MRDYQEVIIKFVKIIEKHPEIYDASLDTYRTRHADAAWEKIAETVRTELNEECTVDEIKAKWKGIRSSYNRFRNKLHRLSPSIKGAPRKKYYLYDSLEFLEPHTKSKGTTISATEQIFEDCGNCSNSDDDDKSREDYDLEAENWGIKIKPELSDLRNDALITPDVLNFEVEHANPSIINHQTVDVFQPSKSDNNKAQKRKHEDMVRSDDNTAGEDLQFFKSILPDIKGFTAKEKRKLKMGILSLIDEIEDGRKQSRPSLEVTSTKSST